MLLKGESVAFNEPLAVFPIIPDRRYHCFGSRLCGSLEKEMHEARSHSLSAKDGSNVDGHERVIEGHSRPAADGSIGNDFTSNFGNEAVAERLRIPGLVLIR